MIVINLQREFCPELQKSDGGGGQKHDQFQYTIPTILPPRYGMLFDFAAMHPFGHYLNDRKVHPNLPTMSPTPI